MSVRLQKAFLQVRDITDTPVAADVTVVRRGMQVGAGSISTAIVSPDPGALIAGDQCYVVRNGAVLPNIWVTLVGDPTYDPNQRIWNQSATVIGSWTAMEFDRLVLTGLDPTHEVSIYDDAIGSGAAVSQPVTLDSTGIFEQWAQHSGYDIKLVDGTDVKYVIGEADELKTFVTPEEFGAIGDGVTNDSAAVQAAMDYAHSVGGLYVRCLPKVYRVGDIAIRRGVHVTGAVVFRSAIDQRYRGTMFVGLRSGVVNGVFYGLGSDTASQESGDRLRGFKFSHITFANAWLEDDWTSIISAPDNKPIMVIEDAARAMFDDCEFTHADRHALILRGVWDSRFQHCRFMESGNDKVELGSGYATTYILDSISGTGYGCNQLFFTDCVWESNADLAIEVTGANPNELSFQNCKLESVTGNGTIAAFTNCTSLNFDFFQTTTAFDDPAQSAIVLNNCKTCRGTFYVEHQTGSGNQLDHYVSLVGSEYNDITVMKYGNDQSVNGILGDDQPYLNTTRVVSNTTPLVVHPVTKHPDAQVNAFEVHAGEVSVLLRRRDKSTYHWLGRLEDDGSGGSVFKHMANGNVAYRILANGDMLLNRPLRFYGGGTFDPADLKGRFSKETWSTPHDDVNMGDLYLFGMWDRTVLASGSDVGQGRLLITATTATGWQMRITGTIENPDGTTTPGATEDILVSVSTPALPTDTAGNAVPAANDMYLTQNVFIGTVTISTVSGAGTLTGMYTVAVDELDDYVTTNRNVTVNQLGMRAQSWTTGASLQGNMVVWSYAPSTKRVSTIAWEDIVFGPSGVYKSFSSVRKPVVTATNERLMLLAYAYRTVGTNRFASYWCQVGAFCNGEYEVE